MFWIYSTVHGWHQKSNISMIMMTITVHVQDHVPIYGTLFHGAKIHSENASIDFVSLVRQASISPRDVCFV